MSSAAAGMFSGYLQAAVYQGLNGTMEKAGWQWLFVMDGVISIPICNEDDKKLARKEWLMLGESSEAEIGLVDIETGLHEMACICINMCTLHHFHQNRLFNQY
jgi:hypothetical protein